MHKLTLNDPIPDKVKKFKAFIKPFEAPQRSVKIKIKLNFYFNTVFKNERAFKG